MGVLSIKYGQYRRQKWKHENSFFRVSVWVGDLMFSCSQRGKKQTVTRVCCTTQNVSPMLLTPLFVRHFIFHQVNQFILEIQLFTNDCSVRVEYWLALDGN